MTEQMEEDFRPIVATRSNSNLSLWLFAAILLIAGAWLFLALNANRQSLQAPATFAAPDAGGSRITSAPPLALPASFLQRRPRPVRAARPARAIEQRPRTDVSVQASAPRSSQAPAAAVEETPALGIGSQPAVVFDSALRPPSPLATPTPDASLSRVTAGHFANPAQTIPQGTVIPAVLETALDSTRPGAARALVKRDIHSFDGSRILINRGSRIYGQYESGLEAGQNRTIITWTRLIRPDGVTISLDSPSSDPLGRVGIKGDVDSKFLQRFGGAILQSVLDVGVGFATREVSGDGVLLALPGSTQNLQIQQRESVQRTLKIRHGTSVSVFVARDLDFSTVDY